MKNPDLVLVDGSSYLYRAFHAMPPLTTSDGQPVGALRGILNMLKKTFEVTQPTLGAVIFDAPGKTFRDDMYPEYKANRPSMPDELRAQIEPIHELVRAMGLPLIMVPDVEADDVIGTLCKAYAEQGKSVLVSTGDKDMAQLVNDQVTLVNTMGDQWTYLDPAGVVEKFGVPPERIIDYLALMGDKVDNVPGVESCGPKTAVKWLTAYGDLDGVVAHADEVKGKAGEKLRAALDFLPLGKDLVTIKLDCELEPMDLTLPGPDETKLAELYTRFEFKGLLASLGSQAPEVEPVQPAAIDTQYRLIDDTDALRAVIEACVEAGQFALDTETTSVSPTQAELVGVSLSWAPGEACYIPVSHEVLEPQLTLEELKAQLQPLLSNPDLTWIAQNLKYDWIVLTQAGFDIGCQLQDTMLISYVLNATGSRHDMDTLALKHLNHQTIKFEEVCGKGKKQILFSQVGLEAARDYACEDADITLRLFEVLKPQLDAVPELAQLYSTLEMPLVEILARLEKVGTLIDPESLHRQSEQLGVRLAEIEAEAHAMAGEEFNLASTKQLQQILFEKLQLPVLKKTPKGAPSTNEEVLQELALSYPLPALLMEHRTLSKLKGTYTDKLPDAADDQGRIHTSLHQAVTATGRLSSSDPNLQNIPIRTPEGRRVRAAFVAPAGHQLVAADYSQVELRVMAHFSQDASMIQAFVEDQDIHSATAAEVFGEANDETRRNAKAINFGLIYGMSAFGLARNLGIARGEAQQYIDTYFARYPGVLSFMDQAKADAASKGYVETLMGRRLYLPDIQGRDPMRKRAAERVAINAPVQGSAADLIKAAMLRVQELIDSQFPEVRMLLQVHDELLFEVPDAQVDAFSVALVPVMEQSDLSVPLKVEVGRGQSWFEAH
jgi:DNA polymerase I